MGLNHSTRTTNSIQEPVSAWLYLENLHHHLLIVGDVDRLKDFAVLATPKFTHQLKIILISVREENK